MFQKADVLSVLRPGIPLMPSQALARVMVRSQGKDTFSVGKLVSRMPQFSEMLGKMAEEGLLDLREREPATGIEKHYYRGQAKVAECQITKLGIEELAK